MYLTDDYKTSLRAHCIPCMQKRPPSKRVERTAGYSLVEKLGTDDAERPIQNVGNRLDGLNDPGQNESDVKRGVGVAPIDTARDDECEI